MPNIEKKNTNIDYINEIPPDWSIIRFKYLIDSSNSGEVIDKSYWGDGEEILYSCSKEALVSNYNSFPISKRTRTGDILLTRNGTPYVFIPPPNSIYTNVVQRVKTKNININYLKWALTHVCNHLNGNGDIIASFNMEIWKNSYICIPSISEQEKIASFLDKKIKNTEDIINTLNDQIKTLFDYKTAIINKAVTKGLNKNSKMKKSDVSWIGDIPENWSIIPFKYAHSKSNVGNSIDKSFWTDDENDSLFYTAGQNPIHTNYTKFPKWKYVKENDILLSRNGTPYVYLPLLNSIYTDHIIRVPILPTFNKKFVKYCLQESIKRKGVDVVSIATWSIPIWDKQKITVPPIKEQNEIVAYLDNKCKYIDSIIQDKQIQINILEEYKKTLIYEYVTGKKRIEVK